MSHIPFHPIPLLETSRLSLRGLTSDDFEVVLHLRSDPQINRYILRSQKQDADAVRAFFVLIDKAQRNNKSLMWGLTLGPAKLLIGTISLWNFSEDRLTAELGYDLKTEQHGKGYMKEAFEAVLDFGFETLGLDAIEAFTHLENTASKRLLERHGFVHQAERVDEGFPHNWIYRKEKQ